MADPLPTAPLTLPSPGDPQLAGIRRKVGLVALRGLLALEPGRIEPGARAALRGVQQALERQLQRDGEGLLAAVLDPDVLTPLLVLIGGVGEPTAQLRAAVPQLLARLRLAEDLLWDQPVAAIFRAPEGAWRPDPPALGLRAGPDGVELRLSEGRYTRLEEPWEPVFWPLDRGVHLALVDSNPLAMLEEHPDKSGNTLCLGERPPEVWVQALREALELVALGLPAWAAELPLALRRLVPVGFEPERHLSASYREAPFVAYLTLHPDPLTLAEAIVHETQHGKLNLLSWLDPVLLNGRTTWTRSPVRPDLRPLMGVLLAVHAFVPVAALHAGLAELDHPITHTARFAQRRAEVLASNQRGLDVLRPLAQPTAAGGRLLEALGAAQTALRERAGPLGSALSCTGEEGPSMG